MATFDTTGDQTQPRRQQFPYKRVEISINKFIKILQIDLDRLQRHKINILRLQAIQDWKALDKEQVNAFRTVQQVKSTIRQLEQTRTQVLPEDLPKYDTKLKEMHGRALMSVNEFLNTQVPTTGKEDDREESDISSSIHESLSSTFNRSEWSKSRGLSESCVDPVLQLQELQQSQEQLVLHPENIPDPQAEQSWRELKTSLDDLNGLMGDFATLVHAQQESVDRIEDNVVTSQDNVRSGVGNLAKAVKLKTAVLPFAGALIGGALGGPVGFIAGIKLGGLAAVGGGLVGFTGGRLLKKRTDESTDVEMEKLTKEGSRSLPDLANNTER